MLPFRVYIVKELHENGRGDRTLSKQFAPVIDIFPAVCEYPLTYDIIGRQLDELAGLGFKRVYFVACNAGYPHFSNPWLSLMAPNNRSGQSAIQSLVQLGDPNFAYMHEAHKRGMEAP